MIEALGRFAEALRAEGVSASPAELLDAARALDALDLSRRGQVKAALRATLAKDRRQAIAFDRVFDGFFAPPARTPGEGRGKRGAGGGAPEGPPLRGRGRGGEAKPGRAAPPPERPRPKPGSPERPPARAAGEAAGDRGRPREAARIRPSQEAARTLASQLLERIRAERPGRRMRIRVLREPADAAADARPLAAGPAVTPRRRVLASSLTGRDERELAREIPKLIQEIRLTRARRASTGRLWPARVFRDSLSTGGVPFELPFRRPRPRRPRVVLLVDVSWSVARAAGYFLWLASEFLRIGRDTHVVVFVDRPVDATDRVRRWLRRGRAPIGDPAASRPGARGPSGAGAPRASSRFRAQRPGGGIVRGGVSFAELLEGIPELNLDAASDYGNAFHGVLGRRLPGGRRDTILVILGDGRSNRFDPLPWTLDEISRRCRAVVWLASEPAARWGTADSRLADYLPYVDVLVEAHDLAGIARGVAELARRA